MAFEGVSKYPARVKCALLGWMAMKSAVAEASGAALGFDRLVMLASGASRIEQVIWSPVAETDR